MQQEIGVAEGTGKLVIPLVQPGIDSWALAMLAGKEYIPFDFANPDEALRIFIGSLKRLSDRKSRTRRTGT